ncbi:shieldin complex subunit 1-like [Molossus molossus]|uniref:shieldin complex subunit 1-like n=1 Tax=Molossus molossus TaxID=27622 RepID=UPI0017478CEF|nr:shieldin complex subunit 1-like [Molossus molossus]
MAAQQATPGSQSEESSTWELPSACDIRDYMLREHSQEAHSENVSSVEALSIPSSSEVDPGFSNIQNSICLMSCHPAKAKNIHESEMDCFDPNIGSSATEEHTSIQVQTPLKKTAE